MSWTALVPLKGSAERKTRLAGRLSEAQRRMLTHRLLDHVVSVLERCPAVRDIRLLSDIPPPGWDRRVEQDEGRGLNAELQFLASRLNDRHLLVILPDLPLLSVQDVEDLLAEAKGGCAIAPDRRGSGTNAIALLDPRGFPFAFGTDSFARHLAAARAGFSLINSSRMVSSEVETPCTGMERASNPDEIRARGPVSVVRRLGLGLDIDTPDDLDNAIVRGAFGGAARLFFRAL
jgi:2-phospho-L-lactate guanylyltransferase